MARKLLLARQPKGFHKFDKFPLDFSNHVYDKIPSEPYTDDPKNGIVVGYDDEAEKVIKEEDVGRRHDGETWYFSSVPKNPPLYDVDYSLFVIGPNPFDKEDHGHQMILISGTHTQGTDGGLRYILDLSQDSTERLRKSAVHVPWKDLGYVSGVLRVRPRQEDDKKYHPKLLRAIAF